MPWIRIDDHYDEHPKFARAGPLGVVMWVAGLAYCNRNLTDGFIPWAVARSLVSWEFLGPRPAEEGDTHERDLIWTVAIGSGMHGQDVDCPTVIEFLLRAGLWDEVDDGYTIHDYAQYQPTKAQITADRAAKAAAGQAGGIATAKARATAPGTAGAKADGVAQSQPVPKPVPNPVPVPSDSRSNAREIDDGRTDLEAFLIIRRRAPTPKQRRLLDEVMDRHDLTGPAWAADIMYRHPDDPIGAVIEADKAWRAERIAAAQTAEKPKPKPRRSPGLPQTTREIMAEMALLNGEDPTSQERRDAVEAL